MISPVRIGDRIVPLTSAAAIPADHSPAMIGEPLEGLRRKLLDCTGELRIALPTQLKQYLADADQMLRRVECRIAVLGQIKAGKSSFINAFVQRPGMLPTHVNPWTTAVTYLHFGTESAPDNVAARFTFFAADEWNRLIAGGGLVRELTTRFVPGFEADLLESHVNAMRKRSEERFGKGLTDLLGTVHDFATLESERLTEYICAGGIEAAADANSRAGLYSDIVKRADLYEPTRTFSFPTTVIDTPGTNDPFLVRDEITRQALESADIHVVMLTARQALSSSDVALLRILDGLNKDRVVIFVNRIDELANVGEDTAAILSDVRRRLRKEFPQAEPQIVAGSASWAQRACSGNALDISSPSGRKMMAYAAHLGLNPAVEVSSKEPEASHATSMLMRCSGMPELNRVIADMARHSHAAHVMGQLAATFRELARVSAPVLSREIVDLASEADRETERIETAGTELRVIESDVRDNERALKAVHSLQVDLQARTTQILEDQRSAIGEELREAVHEFAKSQCDQLWRAMTESDAQRTWTSRPGELRRILERTYLDMLHDAEQQLATLEGVIVGHLQLLIGETNSEMKVDEPEKPTPASKALPFGALRRTIALDLGEPWWRRWWSGTRGASERVAMLDRLIRQEFEPIIEDLVDTANAQLLSRQSRVLKRITMLSLSFIEILQELSETRYNRLRKLMSERDERQILERARQRDQRTAELRRHIEMLNTIARELEGLS